MKNASSSAWRLIIIAGLLFALVATLYQTNEAKTVFYPDNFNVPAAAWDRNEPVSYQVGRHGRIYYHTWRDAPFMIPGADAGRALEMNIRNVRLKSDGSLVLVVNKVIPDIPPVITILVDDQPAGRVTITNADDTVVCHVAEIPIPVDEKSQGDPVVRIRSEGGSWFGGMLIIPHQPLRKAIILLFPLASILAIMGAYHMTPTAKRTGLAFIGLVSFLLFYNFLFAARLLPCNPFFADGPELVDAIRHNAYTSDMKRHALFLPIIKLLTSALALISPAILKSYAIGFSLISAANIVASASLIRSWISCRRTGGLLLGAYTSSFLVMYYSSIFETYMLSTLILNSAMLATVIFQETGGRLNMIRAAALTGIVPLASPPLAAFVPMLLTWQSRVARLKGTSGIRAFCIPWLTALVFGVVTMLGITGYYHGKSDQHAEGIAEVLEVSHDRYARVGNLTAKNAWLVMHDTMISALVNVKMMRTSTDITPQRHWIAGILQAASALCVGLLLLGAVVSMFRQRFGFSPHYFLWGIGWIIYVGFHWYFNPGEMLLYATPVLLLWLIPLVKLAHRAFKQQACTFILSTILICEITALTLTSYCASEALFTQLRHNTPTMEWRGR